MAVDLESYKTVLQTAGLNATTLQGDPTVSLVPDGVHQVQKQWQQLHQLPELALDDGEAKMPDLRILNTLGEGGMGLVRLANQVSLNREVAVKTVRPGAGERASQALLAEAYLTGSLEHPNIIPIYTVGRTSEGAPLIVMKRVEGTSWGELLAKREDLVYHIEILLQVASAVRFSHSRRILHRDIKPENVMIGHFEEVYLLDWGIACALPAKPESQRKNHFGVYGTPSFMAPEMADPGVGSLDERTDVYLLGATLHYILTGEPRHSGDNMLEVLYAARRSDPVDYPEAVPAELAAIANQACHADKERRYESVEAFRQALQDYLRHRESIALSSQAEEKEREFRELLSAEEVDELLLHDCYGECRFGFLQALRMWPENEPARRGLQRTLSSMAAHYLDQGNLSMAKTCLAELPKKDEALEARALALAGQLEQDEKELERLKKLDFNFSLGPASKTRSVVSLWLGTLWTLTNLWAAIEVSRGRVTYLEELNGYMQAGVRNVFIALILVAIFRRGLLSNAANRRMVYLLLTMVMATGFLRWTVWLTEESLFVARLSESLIYVVLLVVAGFVYDRRICYIASAFGAVAVATVLWPAGQLYLMAAGTAATFGGFAWIWRPGARNKNQ